MDDASSLISDLLRKLAELDDKVSAYRTDMAAEFKRYSDDLLRDVPENVTDEVNRAVAASMSRFPSLYPAADAGHEEPESPAIDRRLWDGKSPSPPPVLHHTSGIPTGSPVGTEGSSSAGSGTSPRALGISLKDKPRDPHEREKEFHGVFTPSYLPLLDGSDRPPVQSPPATPTRPSASASLDIQRPHNADGLEPPYSASASASDSGVIGRTEMVPKFPPVRRFTDPPADSSSGEIRVRRRSALRRSSSSSNKTSPGSRRVRFDFEGEEVLPTSPLQATAITEGVVLPPPAMKMTTTSSSSVTVPEPASSAPGAVYDSPQPHKSPQKSPQKATFPASLLDDDDDEYSPPPKKVSSSQALRALSKLPLEDPSTWTVVNASPDPAEPFLRTTRPPTQPPPIVPTKNMALSIPSPPDVEEFQNQPISSSSAAQGILGSPLQDLEEYDDDGSADDDDYISMSLKPTRKKSISPVSRSPMPAAISTPEAPIVTAAGPATATTSTTAVAVNHTTPSPVASSLDQGDSKQSANEADLATPTPATSTAKNINGKPVKPQKQTTKVELPKRTSDDDDDELFDFDEDAGDVKADRKTKPYLEVEEEVELDDAADTSSSALNPDSGRPIGAPAAAHHQSTSPSTSGSGAAPPVASVGSYKGRHISFDIVKDAGVLQKAQELGNFKSFVGSVDGRSGVDTVDPSSWRGSTILREVFSGTPRSLTERMILEELAEEDEDGTAAPSSSAAAAAAAAVQ